MHSTAASVLHPPPFVPSRHPATDEVAGASLDWARRWRLVDDGRRRQRLRRAAAAELAGRACPGGPVDRLRLLADLITWLFVVDDACDEDDLGTAPDRLAPTVAALLDVLDRQGHPGGASTADGPLAAALHDVCRRVHDRHRPASLLRLTSQLREYLLALVWEAANRERRRVPGLAEYVQMRRHTGGARPSLTLTDLAHDGLPADRWADPRVAALDDLAVDLVCWCNDIFSHRKERDAGPDAQNLVTVVATQDRLDTDAALRAAAERYNSALGRYVAADEELATDPALTSFLATRRAWIRGTYDWSLRAARYD